jgi:hypothetical protein
MADEARERIAACDHPDANEEAGMREPRIYMVGGISFPMSRIPTWLLKLVPELPLHNQSEWREPWFVNWWASNILKERGQC